MLQAWAASGSALWTISMIAPCCRRSRIAVVRCSFAHRLAAGRRCTSRKPVVVAASGVEAAMGAGRARSGADRGQLDPARLGQRPDHRRRNRHPAWLQSPTYCFLFGQHHYEGRAGLAPLLLALPTRRRAGRVLRLQPRLRRPAVHHERMRTPVITAVDQHARGRRTTTFRRVRDDRTYKQDWLEFRV